MAPIPKVILDLEEYNKLIECNKQLLLYKEQYAKAVDTISFLHEPEWAEKIGMKPGETLTTVGVRKLRAYVGKLERQLIAVRGNTNL